MRTRGQALGQNFLHHQPTIQKILNLVESKLSLETRTTSTLLEVGPGKLALTRGLLGFSKSRDLNLCLVERDPLLEEGIKSNLEKVETSVDLEFMDAASEKFTVLLDRLQSEGKAPVFFVSNLPYSAATPILANLCHRSAILSGAVVMVQKEVAARMAAPPGNRDRGSFSLLIQSYFRVNLEFDVGPGAFTPAPKVLSTVLSLDPLEEPRTAHLRSPLKFESFCKRLFSQRRKMIRGLIPKERQEVFPKLGISGTERPEVLGLDQVLSLYQACEEDV